MCKKIYLLLVAASTLLQQNSNAQVWLGLYGFRANSTYVSPSALPDIGGGFAMSFLSTVQSFSKPTAVPSAAITEKIKSPIRVQYGANFYWSGLGHRTFENVPLTSQVGTARATINNSFMALNIMARVSAPNKSIFTPYMDVFAGYRGTFSSLAITPYMHNYGTRTETDQNLATVNGLNYGLGGGITTDLTKNKKVKLDLGVSYIEQFGGGQMVDLNSASADNGGINLNMKHAPNGILMVNVGLLFLIEPDNTGKDNCNCNCKHHRSYSSSRRVGGGWGGWGGGGGGSSSVNVHFGGGGRVK